MARLQSSGSDRYLLAMTGITQVIWPEANCFFFMLHGLIGFSVFAYEEITFEVVMFSHVENSRFEMSD